MDIRNDFRVVLGTAMWGWTIDQATAFAIADLFYELGGRWFDTASNYPINNNPSDYGLAERWLAQWIQAREYSDILVIVKLGAQRNDGSPAADLTPDYLRSMFERSQTLLKSSLRLVSLHWDKRANADEIADTVGFLRSLHQSGYLVGLSGIQCPELYLREAPDLADQWWIQIKHNVLSGAAYGHYEMFHGKANFLAYGLNAGGLKLGVLAAEGRTARARGVVAPDCFKVLADVLMSLQSQENAPKTINELSLLNALLSPDIKGVLIGPSRLEHITESVNYLQKVSRKEACELLRAANLSGPM